MISTSWSVCNIRFSGLGVQNKEELSIFALASTHRMEVPNMVYLTTSSSYGYSQCKGWIWTGHKRKRISKAPSLSRCWGCRARWAISQPQVFARGSPSLLRNTSVSHALVTSLTDGREALCLCGFFFFASTVLTVYITVNSHW